MFVKNTEHLQRNFLDTVNQLSAARQERLENSWAEEFYREVFCRLDENLFKPLYAEAPSRPNTPVNQLLAIEILKSHYNWSDEELFDHLSFDLQVRYALGVRDMESEICTLRTVYNFRRRVSEYMQATGKNLFEHCFVQVTDEHCAMLGLDTERQRMDSTQVASNIRQYSRLRLVVEVLQRATRMLRPEDEARYAEALAPYLQGSAGQYCYRVRSASYTEHLQQVGQVVARLLAAWAEDYATHPAYALLQRVFHEHFTVTAAESATEITVKPPEELSAASLQSPDDPEATYRYKNGQGYRGYVANITETCAPENPVQLITYVQLESNDTDDEALLAEAVPQLKERMPLTDLDVDGGYTGPEATRVTREHDVTLHPSAIRGAQPDPNKVGLAEFTWEYEAERPAQVCCPQGETQPLQPGRAEGRYLAYFDSESCATCPLRDQCPTQPLKRCPQRALRVTQRQIEVAQLRQACAPPDDEAPNLRPAVEATVRSVKHPFGDERSQLPVRGKARMSMMIIASAFMVNLRRIWQFRQAERAETEQEILHPATDSFLSRCRRTIWRWLQLPRRSTIPCTALSTC